MNTKPRDAGAHDQKMTAALQRVIDESDKRDRSAMPAGCTTPTGCRENGCHGACLPTESGWLIEREDHFPHHLWLRLVIESHNSVQRSRIDWTPDANLGLRFARREDARAFALLHPEWCTLAILTNHSFGVGV